MPACIQGGQGNLFPSMTLNEPSSIDKHTNLDAGTLLNYRSAYPSAMFKDIAALPFAKTDKELLELTACPTKLCGHHLKSRSAITTCDHVFLLRHCNRLPDRTSSHPPARRDFAVTSFDISSFLQISRARMATYTVPDMESRAVPEIFAQLPKKSLDAVCFFHTFHMLDTSSMLEELHRILRCPGFLISAWNDRCKPRPLLLSLAAASHRRASQGPFPPLQPRTGGYSGSLQPAVQPLPSPAGPSAVDQRPGRRCVCCWPTVMLTGDCHQASTGSYRLALAAGDMFKVHKYTAYENYLRLEHADHLVELLSSMSFMNQVRPPARSRAAPLAATNLLAHPLLLHTTVAGTAAVRCDASSRPPLHSQPAIQPSFLVKCVCRPSPQGHQVCGPLPGDLGTSSRPSS
jgi:SAM-dependent methyltransferase